MPPGRSWDHVDGTAPLVTTELPVDSTTVDDAEDRLSTASQDETTRGAKELMQERLIGCIEGAPPEWCRAAAAPSDLTMPWIDDLLARQDTYRAGALTMFCYAVGTGSAFDMRPFSAGVRGLGALTEKLLPHLSIPATRESPFETLAKGSPSYVGRTRRSWNELLTWASTEADVEALARCGLTAS